MLHLQEVLQQATEEEETKIDFKLNVSTAFQTEGSFFSLKFMY